MDNFRESIVQVLDDLNADLNLNPTPEARFSKLNTWHIALSDITDENILNGFKKIIKTELKFLPSSGVFRKLCINKQKSNAEESGTPYIPATQEISHQNAKKILDKLLKSNAK